MSSAPAMLDSPSLSVASPTRRAAAWPAHVGAPPCAEEQRFDEAARPEAELARVDEGFEGPQAEEVASGFPELSLS